MRAWVEQNFRDGMFSLRGGLYDLNTEFYVTDASALFLNPTYGIGTEFSATGQNGPSIFPTTSSAARFKFACKDFYAQAAVLDGVPGDPANPNGTKIKHPSGDGFLLVAESGYSNEAFGHYAVGAWKYTAPTSNWSATGSARNAGYYFLAEKKMTDKLQAFARLGFADGDVSQFDYSWAAGFTYSGLFSSRPDGQFGVGFAQNVDSNSFRTAAVSADKSETQFELTYSDKLLPWLTVQPDLQYTMNPGTDPALKDAWTGGVRMQITF
jgi:porin